MDALAELIDGGEATSHNKSARVAPPKVAASTSDPLATVQLRSGLLGTAGIAEWASTAQHAAAASAKGVQAESRGDRPALAELADAALSCLRWGETLAPCSAHQRHDAEQVAAVLGARIAEVCEEHGSSWADGAAITLVKLVEGVLSGSNPVAATLGKRLAVLMAVVPAGANCNPNALAATLAAKGMRGMQEVVEDALAKVCRLVEHLMHVHGETLARLLHDSVSANVNVGT